MRMNCKDCPHATAVPYPTRGGAIYVCDIHGCNPVVPETDPWPWDEEDNDKKEVSD